MIEKEVVLKPEEAFNEEEVLAIIQKKLGLRSSQDFRIAKRSIDARSKEVKVRIKIDIADKGTLPARINYKLEDLPLVHNASQSAVIIGAGPAGLFAALRLIELGWKPIILERGKDVRARRRDLADINKKHIVNPESNYCFGEGGAGTYSDGKLYTRSKKRGDIYRILEILVAHGAKEDIMIDAHPHIGTNKLPKIIQSIRESILAHGGEVNFDTKVTGFRVEDQELKSASTAKGIEFKADAFILATGHSARDIFYLLHENKILIEAKPFALGVRVEHPQKVIDQIQYKCEDRGSYLPASSYALVHQTYFNDKQRGVFSFCMCPGGFIVPAATESGEIVVNGMSPSRRDSRFANSGIVAAIELEDMKDFEEFGPLKGLELQKSIEQNACRIAGNTQSAPAQRLIDFTQGKFSKDLPDTSYQPGLHSARMDEVLPPFIAERLKTAFKAFGNKMKGYFTNDAIIVGVESRTSSPVRIPRDKESLEHPKTKRLFPCGEGAGYAGGIVSAAMDGERCAEKVVEIYKKSHE
ncbi:FAD-dependent dehydrogenase [Marivirga tractuosa]|uniref:FAD-dependent pyridine nucleotide-disulfide oxidoreductase n=1 Tax=Marivirga tractuosa (strain ATCC 23168 / DSM 4126 / NBRC 15989 / NCIMB 1408 / VKM B-1430 / H-43) TaxID=643867 RepID=E4TKL4_MARTH|nr:FAD-dependent pyridine nucleotide-disulfide oxidoreductase [Marivirga tractuosa]ADR21180.1 FAD-dependent pyridine nucleotide-disulfide oxidoreductase [Marivirga tractuosa DSM 4126]BDD14367.1 FAD-dependent dehydrogenase [Marivirga tractuosa]